MAKTLGKLRQQTAKLRELDVPPDVSKGTKNFVKKHVYVVHPDANENDDDVFKAANVKRAKRAPDHGYEPGQDADIYENSWNELMLKQDDARRAAVRGAISKRYVTDDPGFAKEPGDLAAAKALTKAGRDPALRKNFRGSAAVTRERRANTKAGLTNSYEPEGNELGEAKLTPERHAAAWLAANPKRAQRTRESFSKHMGDAGFVHFDTRPFKKGRDLGYDQVVGHQNNLLRSLPYNIGENVDKPRPLKKNGKLIPQDPYGEYWGNGNTLDLTPDMRDPKQQEWMRTHPANKKIAGGNVARPNVRSNSVIAKDLAKMQANKAFLQRNSYDPGEDYEHIAALSESDQSLLVDIYNSLTEDNQDRFLEIAETPEGVDKLLDFAITNKGTA